MTIAPSSRLTATAANPAPSAALNRAATQFANAADKTKSGAASKSDGDTGQRGAVGSDTSKVQARGDQRDQGSSDQETGGAKQTRIVNGQKVTIKDGRIISHRSMGSNEPQSPVNTTTIASTLSGTSTGASIRMPEAPDQEHLHSASSQSLQTPASIAAQPRTTEARSTRPSETTSKANNGTPSSDSGTAGSSRLLNAEIRVTGQENNGNQSGGGNQGQDTPGGNQGGDRGSSGVDQNAGGNGIPPGGGRPTASAAPDPDNDSSDDSVEQSPLSLKERREQAIANGQGEELSNAIKEDIAIVAAKVVGTGVDIYGQVALPSIFRNKFLREAVSLLIQNAENERKASRTEVQQLADDIVDEIIDKATLGDLRRKSMSMGIDLVNIAKQVIVKTLLDATKNIDVPGLDESAYNALVGFMTSDVINNSQPGGFHPYFRNETMPENVEGGDAVEFSTNYLDEKQFGDPGLLRKTTLEGLISASPAAEDLVKLTSGITSFSKAILTPVGIALNESSKASITLGVSAILAGLVTGKFDVLQFEVGGQNLTPSEQKLAATINQLPKSPITAIQVDTPFADPKYGSKTTLWISTLASAEPWSIPAAPFPGQSGQPAVYGITDKRLQLEGVAIQGHTSIAIGMTSGTPSVASNEYLVFQGPRYHEHALMHLGSTKERKNPIDLTLQLFPTPGALIRISEYAVGPKRAVHGTFMSPVFTGASVGTKGLNFTASPSPISVPIALVSDNSGYNPDDPLYNDVMKLKEAVPFLSGEAKNEDGKFNP